MLYYLWKHDVKHIPPYSTVINILQLACCIYFDHFIIFVYLVELCSGIRLVILYNLR
jgi:hypothetical protein